MTFPVTDANGGTAQIMTAAETTAQFAILAAKLDLVVAAVTDTSPATVAGISTIGTRAYQAGISPLTVTTSNSASVAITAGEVTLCNVGTSRCFVRAGSTATANDIPIEAGEKFTLRITSGEAINAITASGSTTLNIVPVA